MTHTKHQKICYEYILIFKNPKNKKMFVCQGEGAKDMDAPTLPSQLLGPWLGHITKLDIGHF